MKMLKWVISGRTSCAAIKQNSEQLLNDDTVKVRQSLGWNCKRRRDLAKNGIFGKWFVQRYKEYGKIPGTIVFTGLFFATYQKQLSLSCKIRISVWTNNVFYRQHWQMNNQENLKLWILR